MNATDLGPIILLEPITGLKLRAGNFSLHNQGDENIVLSFHKIVVLPEELLKAVQPLMGKGLIVYKNLPNTDEDSVTLIQVCNEMQRTSEVYDVDGRVRHYYVYDYLRGNLIRNPLKMSYLIETENVKLLEEK